MDAIAILTNEPRSDWAGSEVLRDENWSASTSKIRFSVQSMSGDIIAGKFCPRTGGSPLVRGIEYYFSRIAVIEGSTLYNLKVIAILDDITVILEGARECRKDAIFSWWHRGSALSIIPN